MTIPQILGLILGLFFIAVVVYASFTAHRLDRLHQTVVKSRRALELALRARAEYALELAESHTLDVAGALVVTDSAEACIRGGLHPIVDDGLDGVTSSPSGPSSQDRRSLESTLSRNLRLTVDEIDETELDDEARLLLERLAKARLEVRMTRTFHNSHVDQIRHVRRSARVRLLRLAGRAPMPETVDMDDE